MRPLPNKKSQSMTTVAAGSAISENATGMDQMVIPRRRHFRPILIGAVAVPLLGGTAFMYKTIGLKPSQSVISERVLTSKVSFSSFNETIPVNATVIPENTVFLDTVEGGRVLQVYVEDGAAVDEGEALVTLKNADLELQVISREAQFTQQLSSLAQAQANFDQNQLRYDRELMDENLKIDLTRASLERRLPIQETGVAQSEIDKLQVELNHQEATYTLIEKAKIRDTKNATQNLNQLKQSVQRMQDSVDIVRGSLDQLTLRAPLNGRVSALTLQPGQYLPPGSRVAQIDVTGAFKVRAYANEFYLNRLKTGQISTAIVSAKRYDLVVSKIYPSIANRQFQIDLHFVNGAPENLRRGQNLSVQILMGDSEKTLTIPTGPYEAVTGDQWVFVVDENGKTAQRRNIEVGRKNSDQIEILSGLFKDDVVIVSSYDAYDDSQNITFSRN